MAVSRHFWYDSPRKEVTCLKTILLTGGGTAGHVTPNLALLPSLRAEGYRVLYMGSRGGIEKSLLEAEGVPYYAVSTGKLRRYLSKENLTDVFQVLKGIREAKALIKELKPDLVFSKGGFVAVPVVLGAKKNHVPVILHESDMTPGLANKLAIPAAKVVCTNFPETVEQVGGKGVYTGTPIRKQLFLGNRAKGLALCGFSAEKPVLMMMGGSSGAQSVNQVLRAALPKLLAQFQVLHLCGKGNLDPNLEQTPGYRQLEYADKELPDLFAAADLVLSRAGANAIGELLALRKPNLLIPLPTSASRGDQILNAASYERQGFSMVMAQEELTPESLCKALEQLYKNRQTYLDAMAKSPAGDGVEAVMAQIRSILGKD